MVPYIIQSILLLVAPALFAASIYMLLGRIILLVDGEAHSIVRRTWLTKIFVMGDVLSFLMQSSGTSSKHNLRCWVLASATNVNADSIPGGGIMAGGSLTSMQTGEHIIIGGLILQVLFFGFFIVTAGLFHWRINKLPTARSNSPDVSWRKHMRSLYVTSLLILIRSVFRVIEYAAGNDGYLLRHEIFLYIFDALLMFAVMVWFNWYHPSEVQALLKGGKWCEDGVKMRQVSL